MSSFGTRQTHYERYFFGDSIRISSRLYSTYPKHEKVNMIKEFLYAHIDD
ncbi:4-hydroxyphenylacetate 3-monooxygenase, partial [Bacillus vallismortis]|nr:4-hydroxyphenylacetate 3-monooxygenase [Bacillus vallismortis]